jgi:arylsulfatase A-like enzyme
VLDELARKGLLFENVSTPSPWTLPAHMSLLTGLYPSRHGVDSVRTKLPKGVVPMTSLFSQHGFSTAAIVNSPFLSSKFGFDRDFDHYLLLPNTHEAHGMAKEISSEAMKWLDRHRGERFFLFLHYLDVHLDYCSQPYYENMFLRPYQGVANGTVDQLKLFRKGKLSLNHDDARHLIDLYDAGIRQMDDDLEGFFAYLRREDLFDQTLIIVTSDHGEEFLEHNAFAHGHTQFQEVVHVPLIFHGPEIPSGQRTPLMASLVDVMPTVLSSFDMPLPADQDGIDLAPLWREEDYRFSRRHVYFEASADIDFLIDPENEKYDTKRAIRLPRYKLHYDRLTEKKELYDLLSDPHEKMDVSSQHVALMNSMSSELRAFMETETAGQSITAPTQDAIDRFRSLGYL